MISDSLALYSLHPKHDSEPVIRFGINSMSVNAHGNAYPNWPLFKTKALSILDTSRGIFKQGERYEPLLLQYVDIFDKESARHLSVLNSLPRGLDTQDLWLRFSKTYDIAGVTTEARVEYSQVLASEDSTDVLYMVTFAIQGSLPRDERHNVERWLEEAHILSKKLFWDAVEPEAREEAQLFTDGERAAFSSVGLGDFPFDWEGQHERTN